MKLSVIGCGYLGAVHAAAMAELGHEVVGVDVDPVKIEQLRAVPTGTVLLPTTVRTSSGMFL